MKLLPALLLLATIFLPIATIGDPVAPAFPERLELTAPGYNFVGSAAAYAACAPDGTLRLSAYAKRPDGSEGHTVFGVDVTQTRLVELPAYRGVIVTRGSIVGQSLERCGVGGVLSVVIREKPGTFYLYHGS